MADSRTVLVVDDDTDMQFLLGMYANEAGYTVVGHVGDGQAAVDHWQQHRDAGTPLDAIILDQMMPNLTGLEVVSHIRPNDPDVVLVLISAAMSAGLSSAAQSAGATHALSKTDLRELTAALSD